MSSWYLSRDPKVRKILTSKSTQIVFKSDLCVIEGIRKKIIFLQVKLKFQRIFLFSWVSEKNFRVLPGLSEFSHFNKNVKAKDYRRNRQFFFVLFLLSEVPMYLNIVFWIRTGLTFLYVVSDRDNVSISWLVGECYWDRWS